MPNSASPDTTERAAAAERDVARRVAAATREPVAPEQVVDLSTTQREVGEIAEKIASGKVRKHLEENTLLHQKYVLDDTTKVKDILPDSVSITRFVRYTLGAE